MLKIPELAMPKSQRVTTIYTTFQVLKNKKMNRSMKKVV